ALLGGTAAFISDFFAEITGSLLMRAFYMVLACVIGLVSVYFMPETARASLQGDIMPGSVGSAVVPGTPAHPALEYQRQPEQRGMSTEEMLEIVERAKRSHTVSH